MMNAILRNTLIALTLAAAVLLAGCKPSTGKVTANSGKAFASADPELKSEWDAAMAAMTTNGYADAMLGLRKLKANPKLSAEQSGAVDATLTAINDQMYEAANKGDAAAQRAIDDIRKAMTR